MSPYMPDVPQIGECDTDQPYLTDDDLKLQQLREVVATQGVNGNWDYDPYMHGMFNGMEFALALMEGRGAEYREAPKRWRGAWYHRLWRFISGRFGKERDL